MKILYFSGLSLPSKDSASVHVMKLAQAFADAGHELTLHAKAKPGASEKTIREDYNVSENFKFNLSSFMRVPVYGNAKPFQEITRTKDIPDLVYGRDPVALSLFCPANIPVLLELDALPNAKPATHWAFLKLITQPNFRGIVTSSDTLKQSLLLQYEHLGAEQVFVAHDGADLKEHIEAGERNIEQLKGRLDAPNVGYTGSLFIGKGVEVIERVAKLCPELDFHIIGGSVRQVHRHKMKKNPPNIHFYGFKHHADIPTYLQSFDVVLAPYQHHALIKTGKNISRWISPIKIFEYMAAKKPILCSDLPMIREILKPDHNALLIPAAEEEKWAEAIRYLLKKPEEAKRLSDNAYEELKSKYTWDKRAEAILGFFVAAENYAERFKARVEKEQGYYG
tara:strand:- start:37 stop:1218 length:1182 start_codon:yes stop_codon:yes gene_type:complete